jgi:glucitol operon activator protein
MDYVRIALLALAVFWALQVVGSWYQMRRYRDAVLGATKRWDSGFLGVGSCKVRLGRGAIAIVVLSADMRICQFLSMSGLTVFTRFRPHDGFAGLTVDEFTARLKDAKLRHSITQAALDALQRAQRAAEAPIEVTHNKTDDTPAQKLVEAPT